MGRRGCGYGAVYLADGRALVGPNSYTRRRSAVLLRLDPAGRHPPRFGASMTLGQGLPVSAETTSAETTSLETFLGRWLALTESRLGPSTVRAYRLGAQRWYRAHQGSRQPVRGRGGHVFDSRRFGVGFAGPLGPSER